MYAKLDQSDQHKLCTHQNTKPNLNSYPSAFQQNPLSVDQNFSASSRRNPRQHCKDLQILHGFRHHITTAMAGLGGFGGGLGGGGSNMQQQQEQMRMMELLQELQVADSIRMYNELVQRCFGQCVDTFRSRKLDGKEESCMERCSEKFLKFTQRATQRFQEHQQEQMEKAQKQ